LGKLRFLLGREMYFHAFKGTRKPGVRQHRKRKRRKSALTDPRREAGKVSAAVQSLEIKLLALLLLIAAAAFGQDLILSNCLVASRALFRRRKTALADVAQRTLAGPSLRRLALDR
jgi:hypothetical protein